MVIVKPRRKYNEGMVVFAGDLILDTNAAPRRTP